MSWELLTLISIVGGYLLGSIPFGLLLTRLLAHIDIRNIGSGNIGATNVLRAGHKGLAALTLLLDALKGALAVQLAISLVGDSAMQATALACFLGHLFPVWLHFKGGKGVAVFIGLMLILSPMAGILLLISWVVVAAIFRYASVAAFVSMIMSMVMLLVLGEMDTFAVALVMTLLTFYAHRENIKRLRGGTESRIGQ